MPRANFRHVVYLAIAFAAWPSFCAAGLFGPSNYDECILESMKGVTSDLAARAIMRSCSERYPEKKPRDDELPVQVRAKVTGRAGLKYGSFSGTIYNGNGDYTVTQVTIALIPKGKEKSVEAVLDAKEYNVSVTVAPLTNGYFSVSVDSGGGDDFSWNITKVRGYRAR